MYIILAGLNVAQQHQGAYQNTNVNTSSTSSSSTSKSTPAATASESSATTASSTTNNNNLTSSSNSVRYSHDSGGSNSSAGRGNRSMYGGSGANNNYNTTSATGLVPNASTAKSELSSNANSTVDELMEMSPQLCSQKSTQQPQSPYSNLSSPVRPQTASNNMVATTVESSPVGSQALHPSPQQNNNLTPPPSITQHHRSHQSQQQSSVAMFRDKLGLNSPNGNSNNVSSNQSPGQNTNTASVGSGNPLSPSNASEQKGSIMDRRPSGASICGSGNGGNSPNSDVKFRYPSGASVSTAPSQGRLAPGATMRSPESQDCMVPESRPVGCGTPSSTLSSREGTPVSSMQNNDEKAPNIDISRVKLEESGGLVLGVSGKNNIKQPHQQTEDMLDDPNPVKQENEQEKSSFLSPDPSTARDHESNRALSLDEQGFNRMASSSSSLHHTSSMSAAGSASAYTSDFEKYTAEQYIQHQQQQAMQHHPSNVAATQQQQQQHLQMMQHHHQQRQLAAAGFGQFGASGMAGHETMNNNLLSSSHDNQQHNVTIHPRHHSLSHHAYYQHQLGMQPHHAYPGSTIHHHPGHDPVGMGGLGATAGPSSMAAVSAAAARARHSNVKIGRRPSHLPKELKMKDKSLPPQWQRKLKQRKHGKQAGRWDVYIYSPCGVKFASRKKLKAFCEKNNLPYDAEDFDFTPYGRHIDNSRNSSSSNNSNKGGGSASATASSNSNNAMADDNGRHHSSTSTGSEGTHPGSSPSSQNNYSPPTNNPFLAQNRTSNMQTTNNSMNSSSNSYNPPPSSDFVGLASGSFGGFDPRMENPPNASALDIPQNDFSSSNNTIQGDQNQQNSSSGTDITRDSATTLPYHPSRGHHYPLVKPDSGNSSGALGSDFFAPVDIADMLMDSSTGTSSISSACIPNGSPFYGGASQQQHSSAYGPSGSDLNKLSGANALGSSAGMSGRSAFQGNIGNQARGPHGAPMSNISIGSRASEEGDGEDSLSSSSNAVNACSTRNSSGASGNGGPGNISAGHKNINDLQMFNSGFKTAFSVLNSQTEYDGYPYQ